MQETNLIQQDQPVGVIVSPGPAPPPSMTLCSYGSKLTREELSRVATPAATATHKPIPHEEFQPRTMWSLSNAFTSAFKELEPIPQYKATAKLAGFLQAVRPS